MKKKEKKLYNCCSEITLTTGSTCFVYHAYSDASGDLGSLKDTHLENIDLFFLRLLKSIYKTVGFAVALVLFIVCTCLKYCKV